MRSVRAATTRYELRDDHGSLVAVHGRIDKAGAAKQMWWERPDGSKGLGGLKAEDLPLYGAELLATKPGEQVLEVQPDGVVFIVCRHARTWTNCHKEPSGPDLALVLHQIGGPSDCRCLADLWRQQFRSPWPWLPLSLYHALDIDGWRRAEPARVNGLRLCHP